MIESTIYRRFKAPSVQVDKASSHRSDGPGFKKCLWQINMSNSNIYHHTLHSNT